MVVKPLIVADDGDGVLDAVVMNQKAYNKSTEHGTLWYVHSDTGRVLPYRENLPFSKLEESPEFFRATVDREAWASAVPAASQPVAPAGVGYPDGESEDTDETRSWNDVLSGLIRVIRQRKRDLPEGSYTTYLFNSGTSKIRKKTGEEAVELILATTREETSSEAADLIYHLLVLLEELKIPFDDVIRELESRE